MMSDWLDKKCEACEGGVEALAKSVVEDYMGTIAGWSNVEDRLIRIFKFDNHYQALAFVNAVAWISHTENHHPIIELGFRDVKVAYWTHAIDGISDNDFICAAKVSELL